MRAFGLLMLLFSFHCFAFGRQDTFKVEAVRPFGKYGFRVVGRGKGLTEIKFDCGKVSHMGVQVTLTNNYGRQSSFVLPAGSKASDRERCQETFQKYFNGVHQARSVAGLRKTPGKMGLIELNVSKGGLFDSRGTSKTVSLH